MYYVKGSTPTSAEFGEICTLAFEIHVCGICGYRQSSVVDMTRLLAVVSARVHALILDCSEFVSCALVRCRFGLVRVREHAEEIAFYRGEKEEEAGVRHLLDKVKTVRHEERKRNPQQRMVGYGHSQGMDIVRQCQAPSLRVKADFDDHILYDTNHEWHTQEWAGRQSRSPWEDTFASREPTRGSN